MCVSTFVKTTPIRKIYPEIPQTIMNDKLNIHTRYELVSNFNVFTLSENIFLILGYSFQIQPINIYN